MSKPPPARHGLAHGSRGAQELGSHLENFIREARKPVLVEPGVPAIPLIAGHYSIEARGGACVLEAWSDEANLVRRITGQRSQSRTSLDLNFRKFGGRTGSLSIHDEGAKRSAAATQASQSAFRREFERLLEREYPGFQLVHLTNAHDIEHSLSSRHVRGHLARGHEHWAFIACGGASSRAAGEEILTPGLLWLEQVRERVPNGVVRGLKIFVPRAWAKPTAARLAFLREDVGRIELWAISVTGEVSEVPPAADANLVSKLQPCLPTTEPHGQVDEWCARLRALAPVDEVPCPDGLWSLRIRGIEFARAGHSAMVFGLDGSEPVSTRSFTEVCELAKELARWRTPQPADTSHPLFRLRPESWLESQIRRHPQLLDPALQPKPLYSQVATVSGRDRPIADLLGIDRYRRIVIAEVKAEEDLYLPLQALDYWINVRHYLRSQALSGEGYFADASEVAPTPRLILVAPALKFHPTTETILRYFAPEVDVTRVGVDENWRDKLTVAFRLHGANRPRPLRVKGAAAT